MTDEEAATRADHLMHLVFVRTGLKRHELECPREKSFMTPCVARDGGTASCLDSFGEGLCVGCEWRIDALLRKELEKGAATGGH